MLSHVLGLLPLVPVTIQHWRRRRLAELRTLRLMFSGHLRYLVVYTRPYRVCCDLGACVFSLCQNSSLRVGNLLNVGGQDGDTNNHKGHRFYIALHTISEASGHVSRCAKRQEGGRGTGYERYGPERASPRAFYMDCLWRRRNWDPYLVILPCTSRENVGAGGANVIGVHCAEHFDSDMNGHYAAGRFEPEHDLRLAEARATALEGTLLTPEQLRPDWARLVAARIVSECKLRQHVDAEDVAKLEEWDNLRGGEWAPESPTPSLDDKLEESVKVQKTDESGEE